MRSKDKDVVFITVGTKKQKDLCEKFIFDLTLKYDLKIIVLSDDELFGCRIGSGGALIRILEEFYDGGKILLINSGGISKRSVNYAVRGKAFCNFLDGDTPVTVLENIIENAKVILSKTNNGVLVCCSDILVNTTHINIPQDKCFGLCVKTDLDIGSRHGVMFPDTEGVLKEFVHKMPKSALKELCENNNRTDVFTDTGVIYFNDEYCRTLRSLSKKINLLRFLSQKNIELNLYSDLVGLFSRNQNKENYLQDTQNQQIPSEIKIALFDTLTDFNLQVIELQNQKFIHFGSLKESRDNILFLQSQNHQFAKINSFTDKESTIGKNTVLDNVVLEGACNIGENCIISDITLENISVKDNISVCGVKLLSGDYVAIVCDTEENPKDFLGETEIWHLPRYYKGKSFSESLTKFYNNATETKLSMDFCIKNADYDYYFTRCKYLNDKKMHSINSKYLEYREKIIDNHMSKNGYLVSVKCNYDNLEVNLPLRINFSGTWTDAMPYCIDNGGGVVNAAITVDGKKPIMVTVKRLKEKKIELCCDGRISEYSFSNEEDDGLSDFILHIAAIKAIGITSFTELIDGFRLETEVTDIDKGSGLGTSSILLGGCFKALLQMFGIEKSSSEIIKMVFVGEQLMKTGGGWQDQVGGLLPAVKLGSSVKGIDQDIKVKPIPASEKFNEMFSARAILVPTGQRHFGRFIVNDVVNRYLDGLEDSLSGHREILKLNDDVIRGIENGDIALYCACLNRHRELLKKISPLVTSQFIDNMVEVCLNLADAISFCGAGGGGYLFVILKENVTVEEFKTFFSSEFPLIKSPIKKIDICHDIF